MGRFRHLGSPKRISTDVARGSHERDFCPVITSPGKFFSNSDSLANPAIRFFKVMDD